MAHQRVTSLSDALRDGVMPVKICAKCGARCEHITTLHKIEATIDYEIFRCVNCNFIEWLPRIQNRELEHEQSFRIKRSSKR
jgi:hypothetical protein